MKALTVCQPYASAFFMAEAFRKRVENRNWPTRYRGPLLIHAGKSKEYMDGFDPDDEDDFDPLFLPLKGQNLPFGAIIGMVEMIDCLMLADYMAKYGPDPWANGHWCHVYAAPELLSQPIPYRGQLGIFNVPDQIFKRVKP